MKTKSQFAGHTPGELRRSTYYGDTTLKHLHIRAADEMEPLLRQRDELREAIRDMAAFCRWCYDNDNEDLILSTLIHDIAGIERGFDDEQHAKTFSPRTSGAQARQALAHSEEKV